MIQYIEERTIKAPNNVVHSVVDNLSAYSEWNPWISHAEGDTQEGGHVVVTANLNGKTQQFSHQIVNNTPPEVFHWCDEGWFTLLAKGERIRCFEALETGDTRYHVELNITGPMAWLANWLYGRAMREGLAAEADGLQRQAETLAAFERAG